MKLYIISDKGSLEWSPDHIRLVCSSYAEAFESAEMGEYIHVVHTEMVHEVISAGKMAVKVR